MPNPAKDNNRKRLSNNTGWHVELVPGQAPKRVSHNPRLIDTHPDIAAEWHPTLNGSRTPQTVTAVSTYRAWWLCKNGHNWQRQVTRRTQASSGCPQCELEVECLAVLFPELARQWSPLNGARDPHHIRCSTHDLVWWTCPVKDHDDYQRTVLNRTNKIKPLGCPVCDGSQPEKSKSFGALFPELLKEWHPKLNSKYNPFHLTSGSEALIWWRCSTDKTHEWVAPLWYRTRRNSECPYCRLFYVSDKNRLSKIFPDIAGEWHPTKNRFLWPHVEGSFKLAFNLRTPIHLKERNHRIRPCDVAINCKEVFWWKCKSKGHVWQASVESRAVRGKGCPECAKSKRENEESLAAMYPAVAKLWHPSRNLPLKPTDVLPTSIQKVYWRCPKSATHVWKAHVYSVVRSWKDGSNGCRWCSGLSVDEKNSLLSRCRAVAKMWHSKLNEGRLPSQFTAKSNKYAWFNCGKPKHDFEAKICNVVTAFEKGSNGCKFCRGLAAAPDNCLKRKYPELAKMWHPTLNDKLTPSDVTPGSEKYAFWQCQKGHHWSAKICIMVRCYKNGSATKGCPYCSGKKASKDNNFWDKYPELGKFWDSERNLPTRPWEILPNSKKFYFWRCQREHAWRARVNNVVTAVVANGGNCPKCKRD